MSVKPWLEAGVGIDVLINQGLLANHALPVVNFCFAIDLIVELFAENVDRVLVGCKWQVISSLPSMIVVVSVGCFRC